MVSFLERSLTASALAATIAALLLVLQNELVPEQAPLTFGLVFWAWFVAFYLSVTLPLAVAIGWLATITGHQWLARSCLALGPFVFLALAGLSNRRALRSLVALEGPARYRWLVPAALLLAALGVLAAALLPAGKRGLVRLLAASAGLAALGALLRSDPQATSAGSSRFAPAARGEPLLVVGVDGADWQLMEPMLARGELPNLQALRERGAWGPLRTVRPTLSPAVWTTVVTGRSADDHGIKNFTRQRLRGVDDTLPRLKPVEGVGFKALLALLSRGGQVFASPIVSGMRRAPAFWNIASAYGSPVSVLQWWGTWPAEPVNGYIVSERAYLSRGRDEAVTFPAGLDAEIAPLILRREDVSLDQARRFIDLTPDEFRAMGERPHAAVGRDIESELTAFISLFETTRRVALHLVEKGRAEFGRPTDLLVLFRIVDQTCHSSLRHSELVSDHLGAAEERVRKHGRVVSGAYREMDRALGDLLQAFGPGSVVALSDHGFRLEGGQDRRSYNHTSAPDGIFIGAGTAFRPGRVEGLSVYDVLPLLLYLKDLPIAAPLEGRLDERLISPALLAERPVRRVARYEAAPPPPRAKGAPDVDSEMIERLRALGYLE
jgi:hypothetical protein